jgi:hypothetical protein
MQTLGQHYDDFLIYLGPYFSQTFIDIVSRDYTRSYHHYLQTLAFIPQTWPKISQPRIRVLRHVCAHNRAVERCDTVSCHVVQSILLIWPRAHSVWDRLHIISDLLVDHEPHVTDLRVFDSNLVAVVRADLATVSIRQEVPR